MRNQDGTDTGRERGRRCPWVLLLLIALVPGVPRLAAAERVLDFSTNQPGRTPAGFKAFVSGEGPPADWQVQMARVPSLIEPFSDRAAANAQIPVVAQLSKDPSDERFPVLYLADERFGDFTFTTRFRIVGGVAEQIAGIVFRMTDERNFCVVRVSALGGNVRFYRFVDGRRTAPVGNDLPIRSGQWYELSVKAEGNKFDVFLDGQRVMPTLTDNAPAAGQIGFLTKSDTVCEFADVRINYRPLVSFAETLLKGVLERQPRLLNLRIYGTTATRPELHVLAARNPGEIGLAASDVETGVLDSNETYYGRGDQEILVTAPLRDRNGDAVGVAKFFLKPFAGQTEANAVARVLPTVRWMEAQLAASEGLGE